MKGTKPFTVVMSGGAPTSPLMAGFLYGVLEKGRQFTEFHTSGAGALMALMSLSPPKGMDAKQALRNWVESGVADELYAQMPVNFKLFRKPGPFAPLYQKMAERFKVPVTDAAAFGKPEKLEDLLKETGANNPITELLADWLASPRPVPANTPSDKDPSDRLHERFLKLWEGSRHEGTYEALLKRKDPIKRLRDNFLTSFLKTDDQRRLYNDMVDLYFAAITPSTLSSKSKGLAAPLPFLEDVVDFESLDANLKKKKAKIWVNAYNMTKEAISGKKFQRRAKPFDPSKRLEPCAPGDLCKQEINEHDPMEMFEDGQITPLHIRAAFSMPFIYPPTVINGNSYSEGADQEPINFRILRSNPEKYKEHNVVILDALGALEDCMVRPPRDLWDAYVISIMTPVVGLAKLGYEDFKQECGSVIDHEYIKWRIPEDAKPHVMDWSYSNLSTLFRVGYREGTDFVENHWS